jgi:radical SAM superfamily enzyme YgiQ (UPF0313 family)
MLKDRELMNLMAESGCLGHLIGFESIDERNIRLMNKTVNLGGGRAQYREQVEALREYGLQTWASFTVGHDFDTVESMHRTLEFAIKSRFAFADFNILMPYPGTNLYKRLYEEGRLLYDGKWWVHPEYRFNQAVFIPKLMSVEALTETVYYCRKEFNSLSSILYRAFDFKTNMRSLLRLGIYLGYTPLFRKEILKKQGMRLGLR